MGDIRRLKSVSTSSVGNMTIHCHPRRFGATINDSTEIRRPKRSLQVGNEVLRLNNRMVAGARPVSYADIVPLCGNFPMYTRPHVPDGRAIRAWMFHVEHARSWPYWRMTRLAPDPISEIHGLPHSLHSTFHVEQFHLR